MRRKLFIGIVLLFLPLLSCVANEPARRIRFEDRSIELSGFSETRGAQIESLLAKLKSLKAGSLKIDEGQYRRLSRFEDLFGFPFDGPSLHAWIFHRLPKIAYQNTWTVAVNQNKGTLFIGDRFFEELNDLERLYLLVHEARHSDDEGYEHVKCPEHFRFVSAGQPDMELRKKPACDDHDRGAYAYQAAFLFELFAYGLFDQRELGLLYNSSISRLLK